MRWGALAPFVGLTTGARGEPDVSNRPSDPWLGLKVGVASYSFSKLPLKAVIESLRRVGIHYVSIKEAHLPLKSTAEERQRVAARFRDAGIIPLSCGVIAIDDDEAKTRNAFEYARDAGIPTIVCSPTRKSLPTLDRLVKEFNLKLAIHNHGPEDKVWPSPRDVWKAVQPYDQRIGLCIDVGHTARCDVDPASAFRECASRLHDVHLKDLDQKGHAVEVGRGVLDLPGMLRTLREIGYSHHVGLEHEKDMDDPLPGVAESIGYIRGVLSGMRGK
ncbi:MAG: hypothetical protein NVSMB9_35060 [Isosphaeraceae bacterium]